MNPQDYFNSRIKHLVDELKITDDLSYLLLDYYHWDDSKIIKLMRETPKECLANLHLDLGSESFPTINSSIQAKEGPVEECQICFIESPLLHFYCGHKMCKDCFVDHIKCYDIPVCQMVDDETNKNCNALILPSDIKKYCNDQQILSKYEKNLIIRNEINSSNIAVCDHCNLILTEKENIGCHTAQCPKCHFTSCYKCGNGCHAPVLNCKNINDFYSIKSKYKLLKEEQELWFEREKRFVQYRREHIDEVNEYFDKEIRKWTEKINKSDENKKFNLIDSLKKMKEHFVKSLTCDPKEYLYNIVKFKDEIEILTESQKELQNDDDLNEIILVRCPKCGVLIERNQGCVHMTCAQCKFEFCSKCGQSWDNHSNFYECPFSSGKKMKSKSDFIDGLNYDDENDKKFYPMPFDLEKIIEFNEMNDLYEKYSKNNKKLDDYTVLFIEERRDGVYSKLVDALKKSNEEEKSKEIVSKFLHDILLGQTVVTYGFIQIHYTENKEKLTQLNQKLNELELQVGQIIEDISKPELEKSDEYINKNAELLDSNIKFILKLVDSE